MKTAEAIRKTANASIAIAQHIPYSSHVSDSVTKLKEGNGYLTCFAIEGVDFETCGEEQINSYNAQLHQLLLALGGGKYAIWATKIREKSQEQMGGTFTDPFCRHVAARYSEKLKATEFMRLSHYLTVVYRPNTGKKFNKAGSASLQEFIADELEHVDHMEEVAAIVKSNLKRYKVRRLGVYDKAGVKHSEISRLLGFLVNGYWQEFPFVQAPLGDFLASSRLNFGTRNGLLQIANAQGERLCSFLELKNFADVVTPTQLDQLLYAQQEYIETQSFSIYNNTDAVEWYRRQGTRMVSGGEASVREVQEIKEAAEELRTGSIVAGEYHYSLAVFSSSQERIRKDQAEVAELLANAGFKSDVQTDVPEAAWYYQLPGNWKYRTRLATLTSWNFACLSPFHTFLPGKKIGNPWGESVCVFDSPSGQPYHFNFHCSPDENDSTDDKLPANTFITGKTGSGKTALVLFLVAMLDKFNATVVVLDLDRGAEIALRAMRADYSSFRRGVPTGLNPFQWPDTLENRAFCRKLVSYCIDNGAGAISADDELRISAAVAAVFSMRAETRRLGMVYQNLPAVGVNSLQARLRRWVGEGDLAWVLDNPTNTLDLRQNTRFGFDYTDFIDDAEVCPVFVMTLLSAIESLIKGKPFALFLEEFWKPLQNEGFSAFVKDKLKTIRKENGFVGLSTQQPDDVLTTPLAKTAVQQTVTGIFLPTDKGDADDYINEFKLSPQEFDLVRKMPIDARAFLVKQEGRSAICRLDLGGLDDIIPILSGSTDNLEILDALRAERGDDPDDWMPGLLEAIELRKTERRLLSQERMGRP